VLTLLLSLKLALLQGQLSLLESQWSLAAETHEHIFHIDEGLPTHTGAIEDYVPPSSVCAMPIIAVTAQGNLLLLAQREGTSSTVISKLSLPHLQQCEVLKVPVLVQKMQLNCDSTKLAIISSQVRLLSR
jgi:hypothetical protein